MLRLQETASAEWAWEIWEGQKEQVLIDECVCSDDDDLEEENEDDEDTIWSEHESTALKDETQFTFKLI